MRTILHILGNVSPGPETDVSAACHHLADTIQARGMVIVISDLLDDTEKVLHSFRHFQHKKHDLIVFHLLDDAELDLPFHELSNFVDIESGRRTAVDPAAFRSVYQSRVTDFVEQLRAGCLKTNIDYNQIRTSQPIESVLGAYMRFRARRAR